MLRTKPLVQRRSSCKEAVGEIPPTVDVVLHSPGQPLDPKTRVFMESRFGHDFSQVRVHTDAIAAESAGEIRARAYTVGPNMIFGSGEYNPGTCTGQQLLAHELAHSIQQSNGNSKWCFLNPLCATIQRKQGSRKNEKKPDSEYASGFANLESGLIGDTYHNLPLSLKALLLGTNLNVGFISGLVESLGKNLDQDDFEAFLSGLLDIENLSSFELGGSVGLVIGAGEDLYHNLKGLVYDLPKLAIESYSKLQPQYKVALFAGPLAPALIASAEANKFARDPEKRIELYKGVAITAKDIAVGLFEFIDRLSSSPNALIAEGEKLGRIVGGLVSEWYDKYITLEPDYYYKGMAVGEALGYIGMEIALLFLAPESLIGRGAASTGKGIAAAARKSAEVIKTSKFGQRISGLIEDIPSLKKISKALELKNEKALQTLSNSAIDARVLENQKKFSETEKTIITKLSEQNKIRSLDDSSDLFRQGYRFEVPLDDGSVVRRRVDGIWCRFASPVECFLDSEYEIVFDQLRRELKLPKGTKDFSDSPTRDFPGEVKVPSQVEYLHILRRHPFLYQHFDEISRAVDELAERAVSKLLSTKPKFRHHDKFIDALKNRQLKDAGIYFHIAAKETGEEVKHLLPRGFEFEFTIQSGKGGSRADIFIRDPDGKLFEIDWKTSGKSGLRSVEQMERHASQIKSKETIPLSGQASRSWIDHVRGHPAFKRLLKKHDIRNM